MRDGVCWVGGATDRFALRLYRPRLPNLRGKMVKLWVLADNSRIIRFANGDLLCQFAIAGRPNQMDLGLVDRLSPLLRRPQHMTENGVFGYGTVFQKSRRYRFTER